MQRELTDTLLLLKTPLLERLDVDPVEEIKELHVKFMSCETIVNCSTVNGQPLTESDLSFVNITLAQIEVTLNTAVLDDTSWHGKLPHALLLQNMIGHFPIEDVRDAKFSFVVRGENYLTDGKKVPSGNPLFFLRGVQLVELPEFQTNVAQQPWCAFPKHEEQNNEWLIINFMVPGTTCVQVVCLLTASAEALEVIKSMDLSVEDAAKAALQDTRGWAKCLRQFWTADPTYCSRTFKLFPKIVDGSWAITMAVGKKPALIGNNRLELNYIRGKGYMEVDIDIASSTVACNILGLVRGVSKSMVVDIGIGIEPNLEEEMPEKLLCMMRFSHMDLDDATPIDANGIELSNSTPDSSKNSSLSGSKKY